MMAYAAGLLCGGVSSLFIYRKLIHSYNRQSLLDREDLERKLNSHLKGRDQAATAGSVSQRDQLIQHTTETVINRIIGKLPSFLPISTRNAVRQYVSDTLRLDLSNFYDEVLTSITHETVLISKESYAQFTKRVRRKDQADPLALKWSTLLGVLMMALVISALSLSVYYLVPSAALLWR